MWISGCLCNLNFAIIKYQQWLPNNIKKQLIWKISLENDQLTQGLIILGRMRMIPRVVISSPLPPESWKASWAPWRGRILDSSCSSRWWKMGPMSSNLLPDQPDSSIQALRKLRDYLLNVSWPFSLIGFLEHLLPKERGCSGAFFYLCGIDTRERYREQWRFYCGGWGMLFFLLQSAWSQAVSLSATTAALRTCTETHRHGKENQGKIWEGGKEKNNTNPWLTKQHNERQK